MAFFEGKKMTGGYGGPDIITSCTVNVNRGEIVAILGPNGAGKSTAMKAMLGLINLKSGTVTIDGKDISNLSPQDRVRQGISFVPQTRNVFTGLSVRENLEMGAFLRKDDLDKVIEEIYELFPILKEKQSQLVGELSGGQRQQVALGRALMIKPSVLMLDEPTAGVSPIVMNELFDQIIDGTWSVAKNIPGIGTDYNVYPGGDTTKAILTTIPKAFTEETFRTIS